jgi:hypothetical protein
VFAHDVHERAGRQLREVTQISNQTVVGVGVDSSRMRVERGNELFEAVEIVRAGIWRGRDQPGASREKVRPGCREPARGSAGQWMATDEAHTRWE